MMFCCQRLLLSPLNHNERFRISTVLDSKSTQLSVLHFRPLILTITCFSSTSTDVISLENDKQSFTISYLINSCGLSPQSAKSVSKNVLLSNTNNADSVLSLLRDYGVTDKHISQVVKGHPQVLRLDSDQIILPKLQFLCSIGFSSNDLSALLRKNPHFLSRSLNQYLIPLYDILKSLLLSDKQIVIAMKRFTPRLNLNNLNLNVSILREIGMPPSTISRVLTRCPYVFSTDTNKFNSAVNEVVQMGFDPSKFTFAAAVEAKITLSETTWKHKIDAYGKWGISENEVLAAFRKHPYCVFLSEESISNKMSFLVNKMGWQPADILEHPVILCYSLDKRIVPRCSVIRILLLKDLIEDKPRLCSIFNYIDTQFAEKYVIKYEEQVPELLDIFEGKTDMKELGFWSDEPCKASEARHVED